nr:DUF4870 domain-containing protein [Propionibacterium sp.]
MTNFNQPQWDQRSTNPGWQQPGWQQPTPPLAPHPGPLPAVPTSDERLFAMLAHLSAAIAWVVSAGWLNFVGPLVVWALFKDRSPFVRRAAAGSFNFTLSMTLLGVLGWVMVFTVLLLPIGVLLIAVSGIAAIVLGVLGALRTWGGQPYTYPWQLRVLG